MFSWLRNIFFGLDSSANVGTGDLTEELRQRAPEFNKQRLSMTQFDADTRLCEMLSIYRPEPTDLIWDTHERIIGEMRKTDWREQSNAGVTGAELAKRPR